MDSRITAVVDEGLGNSSYLVDLGDGRALMVDPSRDLRSAHRLAQSRGLRVAYVAETHLHADFVSGARELAHHGATVLASALGNRRFPHLGLHDGDDVDLGDFVLEAWVTPGHTPEHIAYLLHDTHGPIAVFTGGSLLVGSAARTDLISPDRTEDLARDQWLSLQRLLELSDDVTVLPTHGAGSFCAAPADSGRTTSIGEQRRTNPLLSCPSQDAFVTQLLSRLGTFPAYFSRLADENRHGPRVIGETPLLRPLDPGGVHALREAGAQVVDVRSPEAFAAGHLPGALSITLRDAFATWLGWLVDPPRPLIFVRDAAQDPEEIIWQALKVGFDDLSGELAGGVDAWDADGRTLSRTEMVRPEGLGSRPTLDVRQRAEYDAGHLPGAVNAELGSLVREGSNLPDGPLVLMCGHGERAMSAASLLEQAGRCDIAVLDGGPDDWMHVNGSGLVAGR